MTDFKPGTIVKLTNGDAVTIRSKIGEGGQGSVYKVEYNGKEYALKWYLSTYLKSLKPSYKKFYDNLSRNVEKGAPSDHFLWMKAVAVTGKRSSGFGYLMDLRNKDYWEFTQFLKAKKHFVNTSAAIQAAIQIVESFSALHRAGYSYQDLSPGNFFINDKTGDVLICDNDNVAPDKENLGVNGTPGYMAPEVVLGKEKPSTNSDLFSLAVILFELFFLSHPLEGEQCCKHPCLTEKIEKQLYAEHPVFVMSDDDPSNRPVRGIHNNLNRLWKTYPNYLCDMFKEAFSEQALKNGNRRKSERDWKHVLYRLQDDAIICPGCGESMFASMADNNGVVTCLDCNRKMRVPAVLSINGCVIIAGTDKHLTAYHTEHGDYGTIIGTFLESKKTPGLFGLRNDTPLNWSVLYPGKETTPYESGKTVTLIPGTVITIGTAKVQVDSYQNLIQ